MGAQVPLWRLLFRIASILVQGISWNSRLESEQVVCGVWMLNWGFLDDAADGIFFRGDATCFCQASWSWRYYFPSSPSFRPAVAFISLVFQTYETGGGALRITLTRMSECLRSGRRSFFSICMACNTVVTLRLFFRLSLTFYHFSYSSLRG